MRYKMYENLWYRLFYVLSELFKIEEIGYVGATSISSDARDVLSLWRRGESLLDGPYIAEFENELSNYFGSMEAVTFGAGRMGLYAILKAMELPKESEVILPGYTCVVTPNAIIKAGLRPVYVDISLKDFNISPDAVEKAITPRTGVILAQHTFGIPCQMDALLDISKRHSIPLVEDCAHSIGTRWDGKLIGTLGHSAFFSTQLTKMFSTERGGFVIARENDFIKKVRQIQQQAEFRDYHQEKNSLLRWCYFAALKNKPLLSPRLSVMEIFVVKLKIPKVYGILKYDLQEYQCAVRSDLFHPYPARLPNLMAYVGIIQLKRLEADLAHRRMLADFLERNLSSIGIQVPEFEHNRASPSWNRYPFMTENRNAWIKACRKSGLSLGNWLNDPIYPIGSDYKKVGYVKGMCPNAEKAAKLVCNIPVDRRVSINRLKLLLRKYQLIGERRPNVSV
jgi:perosamine synthetase